MGAIVGEYLHSYCQVEVYSAAGKNKAENARMRNSFYLYICPHIKQRHGRTHGPPGGARGTRRAALHVCAPLRPSRPAVERSAKASEAGGTKALADSVAATCLHCAHPRHIHGRDARSLEWPV
mgnify:CR=1 FL=1